MPRSPIRLPIRPPIRPLPIRHLPGPVLRRSARPAVLRAAVVAPLAAMIAVPLHSPANGQSSGAPAPAAGRTDPGAIDAAVEAFTGASVGEAGGAIAPADPRLRLAPCPTPLETAWHGRARTTVRVACPGPSGWRVFVALRGASGAPGSSSSAAPGGATGAARAAPLIDRGDPVTVTVRGRGFTVQQAGEAMEAGRAGEWIGIRLAATSRGASRRTGRDPVRARIVRPGLAEIPIGRAPSVGGGDARE